MKFRTLTAVAVAVMLAGCNTPKKQEAAAVAARIQQGEAAIAVNEAQIALIERQRIDLRARLGDRPIPLPVSLTLNFFSYVSSPRTFHTSAGFTKVVLAVTWPQYICMTNSKEAQAGIHCTEEDYLASSAYKRMQAAAKAAEKAQKKLLKIEKAKAKLEAKAAAQQAKDAAELAMIVDLERNDLGRIARVGTVPGFSDFASSMPACCLIRRCGVRASGFLMEPVDVLGDERSHRHDPLQVGEQAMCLVRHRPARRLHRRARRVPRRTRPPRRATPAPGRWRSPRAVRRPPAPGRSRLRATGPGRK